MPRCSEHQIQTKPEDTLVLVVRQITRPNLNCTWKLTLKRATQKLPLCMTPAHFVSTFLRHPLSDLKTSFFHFFFKLSSRSSRAHTGKPNAVSISNQGGDRTAVSHLTPTGLFRAPFVLLEPHFAFPRNTYERRRGNQPHYMTPSQLPGKWASRGPGGVPHHGEALANR